jgi:hypothetical protein
VALTDAMSALLNATAARLRSALVLSASVCDVEVGPEPHNIAGQLFFSVHGGEITSVDRQAHSLDQYYSMTVTISIRGAEVAQDRAAPTKIVKAGAGLYALASAAIAALHMSYATIAAANEDMIGVELTDYTDASTGARNGFVEPLKFDRAGRVTPRPADWWGAEQEEPGAVGYSIDLEFVEARCLQRLTEMR